MSPLLFKEYKADDLCRWESYWPFLKDFSFQSYSNNVTAAVSCIKILIQLSNIIRLTCELCFSLDFCFDQEITDSVMTTEDAPSQFEVAGEIFWQG